MALDPEQVPGAVEYLACLNALLDGTNGTIAQGIGYLIENPGIVQDCLAAAIGAGALPVSITDIDFMPTGNPDEYTTQVTWVDEVGVTQVTNDGTPVTISHPKVTGFECFKEPGGLETNPAEFWNANDMVNNGVHTFTDGTVMTQTIISGIPNGGQAPASGAIALTPNPIPSEIQVRYNFSAPVDIRMDIAGIGAPGEEIEVLTPIDSFVLGGTMTEAAQVFTGDNGGFAGTEISFANVSEVELISRRISGPGNLSTLHRFFLETVNPGGFDFTYDVFSYDDGSRTASLQGDPGSVIDVSGGIPAAWSPCGAFTPAQLDILETRPVWITEDLFGPADTIDDGESFKEWRAVLNGGVSLPTTFTLDNDAYVDGTRLIFSNQYDSLHPLTINIINGVTPAFNDGTTTPASIVLAPGDSITVLRQTVDQWEVTSRYPTPPAPWAVEDILTTGVTVINDGRSDKEWRGRVFGNQNLQIDSTAYPPGTRLVLSKSGQSSGVTTFEFTDATVFNDGDGTVATQPLNPGENITVIKQPGGAWEVTSRYPTTQITDLPVAADNASALGPIGSLYRTAGGLVGVKF